MKRLSLVFILSMLGLSILACSIFTINVGGIGSRTVGSGNLAEETRSLGDLNGVSLDTVGHLEVRLGDENSLRIEADDNIIPILSAIEAESATSDGKVRIFRPATIWAIP
jgi:hypothetical protein